MEELLSANDPGLAISLSNLANIYWKRNEFAKAEPLVLRASRILKASYGPASPEFGQSLSILGALYGQWAAMPGQASRGLEEAEYKAQALAITRSACGMRHPATAVRDNNLAIMKARKNDWTGAAAAQHLAVAIMLSLDLVQHPDTQTRVISLIECWQQSGEADKAARLQSGDIRDLLPVIAQIEAEHRAWVAEDPKNRHFGPPSPFADQRP